MFGSHAAALKAMCGVNLDGRQHVEMTIGSDLVEHNRSKFAEL